MDFLIGFILMLGIGKSTEPVSREQAFEQMQSAMTSPALLGVVIIFLLGLLVVLRLMRSDSRKQDVV